MKYFEVKQPVEVEEEITGQKNKVKLDYKQMFIDLLRTEIRGLSSEEMFRLAEVYQKAKKCAEGDVLEIEDQDYSVIMKKYETYVGTTKGFSITLAPFVDFLKYVKSLPKEDPRKKLEAIAGNA